MRSGDLGERKTGGFKRTGGWGGLSAHGRAESMTYAEKAVTH